MSQDKQTTIDFIDQVPSFPKTDGPMLCATMFFHLPAPHPFNLPPQPEMKSDASEAKSISLNIWLNRDK